MTYHPHVSQNPAADAFRTARRQAAMEQVMARFTGHSTQLLSFHDVCDKLKLKSSRVRGQREIPLEAIVGSTGRYTDFTRNFLPLKDSDQSRWVNVKKARASTRGVPPIEVYQIGDVYFVLDGNHRVSVAREMGDTHIEAVVTQCQTKVPLSADDDANDLIVKAEYANFLEHTRFDKIRPGVDLWVTIAGQYAELETHIEAHHFLMMQKEDGEVSHDEAVGSWYDEIYLPLVEIIRERGLLGDFPNRTETDLYLWIFQHRSELEKKLGWHLPLEAVATNLATEHSTKPNRVIARVEGKLFHALTPQTLEAGPKSGQWRQERVATHHRDNLFADILVPVSGEPEGWYALDLAITIAHHEEGHIFGLHVVSSAQLETSETALATKAEFERRCRVAGLPGELSIVSGKVVGAICDRAQWADLIVMYPATPPGTKIMSRVSSGSRTVIYRSCRPVLTVPAPPKSIERVLLAYDGSPKAKEGLFVAAYMAELWQVDLTVLTVIEQAWHQEKLAEAQIYVEQHGLKANVIAAQGNVADVILQTAHKLPFDLVIIGGYGVKPIREVVLGSKVDHVLREAQQPILVCR